MKQTTEKSSTAPQVRRILRRTVFTLVAVLLLIGLLAPVLDGSRFSAPIQRALESSLGRRVSFGKVHFTLFTGPGVSLDDVVISEDPRYGLEPFAYVSTLRAHLRVDKLLMGRIQFSSLRLVDPALNLVKRSDGTWNVVTLVERVGAPRRMPLNLFPAFEVTGGRIDFKLGTRKTTLYLSDADLAVYPQRSGKLYIRFSGSPARTDRAGNGFGHLRGTANWYLKARAASADQLDAD
ncbi:MAG: AsmA family protein, partial [Acidobacteriaceae bacterium]|nr:AsmA family protein [Acidobacteriaceae bacterium]